MASRTVGKKTKQRNLPPNIEFSPVLHKKQREMWARTERFMCIASGRRFGKALDENTLILTNLGYKQIKDIQVDDEVYAVDGTVTPVIDVSETFTDRPCYEIEFSDGFSIVCDEEHEWTIVVNKIAKTYDTKSLYTVSQYIQWIPLASKVCTIRGIQTSAKYIISITPTGPRNTKCITIQHESGIYYAGTSLIPTHNSIFAAYRTVQKALQKPNSVNWVIAPTYNATMLLWRKVIKFLPEELIEEINRSESVIYLVNGAEIWAKSADRPEVLRGEGIDFVVLDEAAFIKPEVWSFVIRPALADKKGGALIIGTPCGLNYYYDLFQRGVKDSDTYDTDWISYNCSSWDNPVLDRKELEELRDTLPPMAYQQEICHLPDTDVLLNDGNTVKIKDITEGMELVQVGGNKTTVTRASYSTGEKHVVKVVYENGEELSASEGHKLFTSVGKQSIENATDSSFDSINRYPLNIDSAKARIVGHMIGDGSLIYRSHKYKTQQGNKQYSAPCGAMYSSDMEDMRHMAEDLVIANICDTLPNIGIKKCKKPYNSIYQIQFTPPPCNKLIDIGVPIGEKVTINYSIPDWIKNGSNITKREFLAALWGSEGSTPRMRESAKLPHTLTLSMNKHYPYYNDDVLFDELVQLHEDLGVHVTLKCKLKKYKDIQYISSIIYIDSDIHNVLKFFNDIGYKYCKPKEDLAHQWAQYLKSYIYDSEHRGDEAKRLRSQGLSYAKIGKILNIDHSQAHILVTKKQKEPSRNFPRFSEWLKDRFIDGILYIKVVSRNFDDISEVYNITVDSSDHSYVLASGIGNYNCAQFIDDAGIVFTGIKGCIREGEYIPVVWDHLYLIGVDLAKHEDFTVITVFDVTTNDVVYFERFNQIDWSTQKARITAVAEAYNKPSIVMDSTGVGDPIAEDLMVQGLNITPFKFTSKSKPLLIQKLIFLINNTKITFPRVEVLIDELQRFTFTMGKDGKFHYAAPSGQHDDCPISLALAVYYYDHIVPSVDDWDFT